MPIHLVFSLCHPNFLIWNFRLLHLFGIGTSCFLQGMDILVTLFWFHFYGYASVLYYLDTSDMFLLLVKIFKLVKIVLQHSPKYFFLQHFFFFYPSGMLLCLLLKYLINLLQKILLASINIRTSALRNLCCQLLFICLFVFIYLFSLRLYWWIVVYCMAVRLNSGCFIICKYITNKHIFLEWHMHNYIST